MGWFAKLASRVHALGRYSAAPPAEAAPAKTDAPLPAMPLNITRAYAGHLVDAHGVDYIDMISCWGANILGYGHPRIAKAVGAQIDRYANLGTAGPEYTRLYKLLTGIIPCAQALYTLKNGSDATTAAVRLARAVTGREKILYRGYHGVQDWYMASTACEGIPEALRSLIVTLPELTPDRVRQVLEQHPKTFAALIIDPMVWPIPSSEAMRQIQGLVRNDGGLLIFDEIVSGFRVSVGGMQQAWGVTPDLACFGKAIANGLPLSIVAGKKQWMERMPAINYSLTFGLEAVSMVAAIETIQEIIEQGVCRGLAEKGCFLKQRYAALCQARGISSRLVGHDCRPQLEFDPVDGFSPSDLLYLMTQELARLRICTYGTFSLTHAHTPEDLRNVVAAFERSLNKLRQLIPAR